MICLTCGCEYKRTPWQTRNRTRDCGKCRAASRKEKRDAKRGANNPSPKCNVGLVRSIFEWRSK